MKAQCERCKEIVSLEFRVAADGIEVTCPACQARYAVAQSAPPGSSTSEPPPAPPAAPAETTAARCPKCDLPRAGTACRRCGLVFAKWAGPASAAARELDPAAMVMWAACLERWEDEARHEVFITHCQQTGQLGVAAARYRGRSPSAASEPHLARIRTAAEKVLVVMPHAAGKTQLAPPTAKGWILALILLVVAVAVGGYILDLGSRRPSPAPAKFR